MKLVRALNIAIALGVMLGLAIAIEGMRVVIAVRAAQVTLDGAATQAATAIDVANNNGISTVTLRLEDRDNAPSAQTLARDYIQLSGMDDQLAVTGIVDDGGTVYVQGVVRVNALLGRVMGYAQYDIGLISQTNRDP